MVHSSLMYANYTLRAHPSSPSTSTLPYLSQHALTRVDLLSTLSQSPLNVTNRFQTRYSIQSFSASSIYRFFIPCYFLWLCFFFIFSSICNTLRALFLTLWLSNAHFLNFSTLIVDGFSVVCIISFRTLSILTSYLTDWNSANLSPPSSLSLSWACPISVGKRARFDLWKFMFKRCLDVVSYIVYDVWALGLNAF